MSRLTTRSSATADPPLERRALFILNMMAAIIGGLSLVPAVTAPFNIGMSGGGSFRDILEMAAIFGSFPLICAASIVLSRLAFANGRTGVAAAIAIVPLLTLAVFFLK
jgi:hypothetical protein